jgi:hypothetical protein
MEQESQIFEQLSTAVVATMSTTQIATTSAQVTPQTQQVVGGLGGTPAANPGAPPPRPPAGQGAGGGLPQGSPAGDLLVERARQWTTGGPPAGQPPVQPGGQPPAAQSGTLKGVPPNPFDGDRKGPSSSERSLDFLGSSTGPMKLSPTPCSARCPCALLYQRRQSR